MPRGVWRYSPARHELRAVGGADRIERLASCVSGQAWIAEAAAIVVVSAVQERTERKYGSRAELYVAVEAGAAAQNLALEATALGLGSTFVGAFDERLITRDVELRPGERPLLLLPVGRR